MSAIGKRHMERVAQVPCVLCTHLRLGQSAAEVHHIREGQGAAQRASGLLTVALCTEHHRGASGIHGLGRKRFYTQYKLTELDLLAMTLEALEE
jgi:hypothetical protein